MIVGTIADNPRSCACSSTQLFRAPTSKVRPWPSSEASENRRCHDRKPSQRYSTGGASMCSVAAKLRTIGGSYKIDTLQDCQWEEPSYSSRLVISWLRHCYTLLQPLRWTCRELKILCTILIKKALGNQQLGSLAMCVISQDPPIVLSLAVKKLWEVATNDMTLATGLFRTRSELDWAR
jgi:hypothetical protein